MPVLTPLVSSLSLVVFVAFLGRLGLGFGPSAGASVGFGLALGISEITAGATKEAFALPLLATFMLLLLKALQKGGLGLVAASLLTFASLLLAHHLTSVVSLFMSVYLLTFYAIAVKRGIDRRWTQVALLVSGLTLSAFYYFFVYAAPVQLVVLSPELVISIVSYEIALLLPISLALSLSNRAGFARSWVIAVIILVFLVVVLSSRVPIGANAPVLPPALLWVFFPYAVLLLLSVVSFALSRREEWAGGIGFSAFWGLGLLGVAAFEMFGTPGDVGVALRIVDFVLPAAALAVFARLSQSRPGVPRNTAVFALTALVAVSSFAGVLWLSFFSGPLGGSQRAYFPSNVFAADWTAGHLPSNQTLYADARFSFLLSLKPAVRVDILGGYLALARARLSGPSCLLLSSQASQVGYVLGEYGLPINLSKFAILTASASTVSAYSAGGSSLICSFG